MNLILDQINTVSKIVNLAISLCFLNNKVNFFLPKQVQLLLNNVQINNFTDKVTQQLSFTQ